MTQSIKAQIGTLAAIKPEGHFFKVMPRDVSR
jgi:hypothetical protein